MNYLKLDDNYFLNLDQITFIEREPRAIVIHFPCETVLRLEGEPANKVVEHMKTFPNVRGDS